MSQSLIYRSESFLENTQVGLKGTLGYKQLKLGLEGGYDLGAEQEYGVAKLSYQLW